MQASLIFKRSVCNSVTIDLHVPFRPSYRPFSKFRFPPLSNASHGSKVLLIVIHTLLYQELENEMKAH
jgi:hypothetical protein